MGVKVCKPCSQNNENDEIIFSNRYKKRTDDSVFYNNSKLYSLNTNFNLTESEYNKAKIIIEEKIKEKGEFSKNLNIKEIISSKNPIANEINVSEVIINSNNLIKTGSISIQEPAIKFPNGEIYEGGWNIKAQRHGFGISINKENNVYKGLWENDNFGAYGAFIEKNGNKEKVKCLLKIK